ncbi:PREDICTED: polyol transporter 5-like [Prunus mume]|uniref:Polyol transporter 5-like n=1 Tax=Prunus mume TaxID=102107 RepID=A0ABM1LST9_PRUMU|nr:PREDICTED: polyol transporter 5-like [Prunus mume]
MADPIAEDFDPPQKPKRNKFAIACSLLACTPSILLGYDIGVLLQGRTSDWIGRRYTAVLSGAIFFVGAILMGVAPGYAFLTFGRFVAGIGVGYGLMISPVYTAEIAPTLSRGFLTSFPEVKIQSMKLGLQTYKLSMCLVAFVAKP